MRARFLTTFILLLVASAALAEDPPQFITSWGSSGSDAGQFNTPHGLTVDSYGEVYVADCGNNRVQKFSNAGNFVGTWGSTGSGMGHFTCPIDVAVDNAGTIYITDGAYIQVFSPTFAFLRQWSVPGTGTLALDPTGQYLYTPVNTHIYKYRTSDGQLVTAWQYANDSPIIQLGFGVGPSGVLYVPVVGYVAKYAADGAFLGSWQPQSPAGAVGVDSNEAVYVTTGTAEVQKYTADGLLVSGWQTPGGTLIDIAIHGSNGIFVLSQDTCQVLKYGYPPVPAREATWGKLKLRYR